MKAIAAKSENNVIGRNGHVPWFEPDDMAWFRQCTSGGIVVMGRTTFASIGRPLIGRETVVLSSDAAELRENPKYKEWNQRAGLRFEPNLNFLADFDESSIPVWVAGGAKVYEQFLPYCSELYLTTMYTNVEDGDAFFPKFDHLFGFEKSLIAHSRFSVHLYRRLERPNKYRP